MRMREKRNQRTPYSFFFFFCRTPFRRFSFRTPFTYIYLDRTCCGVDITSCLYRRVGSRRSQKSAAADSPEVWKVPSFKPEIGQITVLRIFDGLQFCFSNFYVPSAFNFIFFLQSSSSGKWRVTRTVKQTFTREWLICVVPWYGLRCWLVVKSQKSRIRFLSFS